MARERDYAWLGGLLVGAAAMYLLDPKLGAERRDRLMLGVGEAARVAEEGVTRLLNAEPPAPPPSQDPLKLFLEGRVDDRLLYDRVRMALSRLSSHPDAILVTLRDGVALLEGHVLEREVTDVLLGVRRTPGLVRVESRMTAVARLGAAGTPVKIDLSPGSSATARAAAALVAMALGQRRNLIGLGVAVGAGFAVARANGWRLAAKRPHSVTAERSIEVDADAVRVFQFWSDFRNYPRFMDRLLQVRELGEGVSHWIADNGEGEPLTWDAEITSLKPHRRIAWRSIHGADIRASGEVAIEDLEEGRCRLSVKLEWPGAAAGEDAEARLTGDLERFQALMAPAASFSL